VRAEGRNVVARCTCIGVRLPARVNSNNTGTDSTDDPDQNGSILPAAERSSDRTGRDDANLHWESIRSDPNHPFNPLSKPLQLPWALARQRGQ
jgi:hypothetical protein